MQVLDNLLIKIFSEYVGEDELGNRYYISKSKDSYGIQRRRVIYRGMAEPSKIPPMWHAWLHYVTDEVPIALKYKWQKSHMPNLTGSDFAYKPKNLAHPDQINENKIYEAWKPNEEA